MICIRIFRTSWEAERGKEALAESGITATVSEDKFNDVPIQRYGVPARFRLLVADEDYLKSAQFLVKKLRLKKVRS